MNLDDPAERTAIAGEYVLGTLDAAERVEFERALSSDPALQAAVYAWQDRLLGLSRHAAPIDPPAALWQRIESATGGALAGRDGAAPTAGDAPSRVAPDAAAPAAAAAPVAAAPAANDPSWRRIRLWQSISGLAIAASLMLATLLVLRDPSSAPPAAARYLAVLQSPDRSGAAWVVEVIAGDRVRLVPIGESAAPPAGKALQFWTKPQGAAGPTSLGLVRPGQVTELPIARLPAVGDKQLFELTLEGEAGSPIGRPTGPVLYVGSTVRL